MSQIGDRWGAMESTSDPDWFVRFLERTSTRPGEHHPALALLELSGEVRCLDVGSGLGEDARAMAEMTRGLVVGIDSSRRMVAEARSRSTGQRNVAFLMADARELPFAGGTFDAGWIKRTLMHLPDAANVVGELARVVRPGRRIVAVEPDVEIILIDSGLADVTRRLLAYRATGYANPWAGRRLRGLLLDAGLTDVQVKADHDEYTDLASAEVRTRLVQFAHTAAQRGILTAGEVASWEEDVRTRDARGRFACYVASFTAWGRVP